MEQQYQMARKQRVSFTEQEADQINEALEIIESFGGKASPNKFIRQATIARAIEINKAKDE
ncbi:hypothetical protein ACED51_10510 [Photobacterium swingsii]|uniref:Uncharacterized protein n=2 Tax=Vibrio TaxID=662 RepID=A0A0H3ZJI2_9VIBR|nr:hypothetical protein [Vibrio tasmaniensis]AKN40823.1 hypothetical protein [Vibrio sp. 1F_189]